MFITEVQSPIIFTMIDSSLILRLLRQFCGFIKFKILLTLIDMWWQVSPSVSLSMWVLTRGRRRRSGHQPWGAGCRGPCWWCSQCPRSASGHHTHPDNHNRGHNQFWLRQKLKVSHCVSVCLFCSAQVCLKHRIFIFLCQVCLRSL